MTHITGYFCIEHFYFKILFKIGMLQTDITSNKKKL
jgi:hypothetical protein